MLIELPNVLAGARVLCVDDNPDALELLDVVLSTRGAEVVTSSSAEAAIALLKLEEFDVVVSDLQMPPGLDGYDLAHELRTLERNDPDRTVTPTVAVSGDAKMPSKKRHFADFQVYLSKPFNHKLLVHVVARLKEANGSAVIDGSLASWEANSATKAAYLATKSALAATIAAEVTLAEAEKATKAAFIGHNAALLAVKTASEATEVAAEGERVAVLAVKAAKENHLPHYDL